MPLEQIGVLADFGAMVRKAFADRDAASIGSGQPVGDRGHRQQQLAVAVPGENDPLTLLVRGTQLLSATESDSEDAETTGDVVVFDDISDVGISAQRSVAWGEVARRLAHEIKNPAHADPAVRRAPANEARGQARAARRRRAEARRHDHREPGASDGARW